MQKLTKVISKKFYSILASKVAKRQHIYYQWTNSDLCLQNNLNMQLFKKITYCCCPKKLWFELTFFHLLSVFLFFRFLFGQIDLGLPYLCEVLKELPEQKQTKSWYMLRARSFSTCSSYLALDSTALPQTQRSCLTQYGQLAPWFTGQGSAAYRWGLRILCH